MPSYQYSVRGLDSDHRYIKEERVSEKEDIENLIAVLTEMDTRGLSV